MRQMGTFVEAVRLPGRIGRRLAALRTKRLAGLGSVSPPEGAEIPEPERQGKAQQRVGPANFEPLQVEEVETGGCVPN